MVDTNKKAKRTAGMECSLYPEFPQGTRILSARDNVQFLSLSDKIIVYASSMFVVGSLLWVPVAYVWAWKKWRSIPKKDKKRRALYAAFLIALGSVAAIGPHRSPRVGTFLNFRKWRLWKAWLNFVAFEVVTSSSKTKTLPSNKPPVDVKKDQVIYAIIPHGIVPFALGLSALAEEAAKVFGLFRPVAATATIFFPFVRSFLGWSNSVDASRSSVERAISRGDRIGIAPGGIAEMFEGYPKPMTHPDSEYTILKARKGFIRLAVKYGVPVVPVYCFGSTKILKRLQLPSIVEKISNALRISICLFFGQWGLPIPFRQRFLYAVGDPIYPPTYGSPPGSISNASLEKSVNEMHAKFCDEIIQLFDKYKASYGWGHKTLRIV